MRILLLHVGVETMTYQLALAQLRHAYAQLHAGTVKDQKQFAEGLLGPAIEALERGIEQDQNQ